MHLNRISSLFLHHLLFLALFLVYIPVTKANAAGDLSIIRDAETEEFLQKLSKPIFEQAGLSPSSVRFVLVQDNDINAFVAGGLNIFIYTGLLKAAKNPDELVGVIAHETGHIAGGHLLRSDEAMRNASITALLGTVAGLAAAVGSRDGATGVAAVSIGQQMAQRNLLQYSRAQESAADQAALRFLHGAGISASGLHDFLERLEDQELLPENQQVEFVMTHPLTRDRVEAVESSIAGMKDGASHDEQFTTAFDRIKAKLDGYIDPRNTLAHIKPDDKTFTDHYARAIALHQTGDIKGALQEIDALLQMEKNNPYVYELKGQILYESGRVAESIEPYQKSVQLSGGNALLRIGYAQALLNSGGKSNLQPAINELEDAHTKEGRSPLLWRLLATAYGQQGDIGMATYSLAEESLLKNDRSMAVQQAKRARELLPENSSGWIRAGDVLANAQKEPNSENPVHEAAPILPDD